MSSARGAARKASALKLGTPVGPRYNTGGDSAILGNRDGEQEFGPQIADRNKKSKNKRNKRKEPVTAGGEMNTLEAPDGSDMQQLDHGEAPHEVEPQHVHHGNTDGQPEADHGGHTTDAEAEELQDVESEDASDEYIERGAPRISDPNSICHDTNSA